MTTKVTVHALDGWPVDVTPVAINGSLVGAKQRVPKGETREFYVHSGQDLLVHEVQPSELAAESEPKPELEGV